jgi:hypothetical protein
VLAQQGDFERNPPATDDLLRELTELRELDRRRNTYAPGSASHDRATAEVDDRTQRLMDRFRDRGSPA